MNKFIKLYNRRRIIKYIVVIRRKYTTNSNYVNKYFKYDNNKSYSSVKHAIVILIIIIFLIDIEINI